jgi:hypothetical protein
MVVTDLVEVRRFTGAQSRTSYFEVLVGQPMALNMTTVAHFDHSVLHTKAIYRLEDDRLTYCVGAPCQRRPTHFTTQAGDGNTLVVLQRSAAAWRPAGP